MAGSAKPRRCRTWSPAQPKLIAALAVKLPGRVVLTAGQGRSGHREGATCTSSPPIWLFNWAHHPKGLLGGPTDGGILMFC